MISAINSLKYEPIMEIEARDLTAPIDLLWKASVLFQCPRPAWSGMMQFVHHGEYPGRSSMMFLPMIDMNPSDVTCVYSTLKFICNHATEHRVIPVVTFDQPLWWKALSIIIAELREVTCER